MAPELDKSTDADKNYLPGFKTVGVSSEKFQSEVFGSRQEQTLAGNVVGAVRDLISAPKSAEEQAKRAHSNDEIAHIAADTVAALPMVKSVTGGLVRASLLADPHKSLSANAAGFGLNFVEGVALNQVSRLAMPESSLSRFATANFGNALVAESATHLTVGFGFGAIRSGFNADTWKDQNGNFDLRQGSETMLKSGLTGALFNLPAGLIGTRVARASSVWMGEGASPRIAQIVAGVGSGYASGGVFGGMDAVMQGKSWTEVLHSVNQGGMVGAVTGGLVASIMPIPQRPRETESLLDAKTRSLLENEGLTGGSDKRIKLAGTLDLKEEAPSNSATIRETSDGTPVKRQWVPGERSPFLDKVYEALDFKPEQFPKVAETFKRLGTPTTTTKTYYTYKDTDPDVVFKDFSDFFAKAQSAERQVQVYEVAGHKAKIAVPAEYAAILKEVRALRIKAEQPSLLDNLNPNLRGHVMGWIEKGDAASLKSLADIYSPAELRSIRNILAAKTALANHPYGNRALPEDLIPLLDELPNRTQIKELTLVDERWYQDRWHQQEYKKTFTAAATAGDDGTVTFYQTTRPVDGAPQTSNVIRGRLFHEDSHLVPDKNGLWEMAAALEKDGYYVSDYSRRNASENYAEHRGTVFLMPDADQFLLMAEKAPLRTTIIAKQLAATLNETPQGMESPFAGKYRNRIKFVEDHVLPYAQEQLNQYLASGNVQIQTEAAKLLAYIGAPEQVKSLTPLLKLAGATNADGVIPPEAQLANTAFESANKLLARYPSTHFDWLVEQAMPGSPVRDRALPMLMATNDPRRIWYSEALKNFGDNNKTPNLVDLIGRMPDKRGTQLVFDEIINQTNGSPDAAAFQTNFAIRAFKQEPWLRLQALKVLQDTPSPELLPGLRESIKSGDADLQSAARTMLGKIATDQVNTLRNQGAPVPVATLEDLMRSQSSDALSPLLRVAVSGHPSAQTAQDIIGRFNRQMVKYYAQLAQREPLPLHEKHAIHDFVQMMIR